MGKDESKERVSNAAILMIEWPAYENEDSLSNSLPVVIGYSSQSGCC
jgi:hypothetical protein